MKDAIAVSSNHASNDKVHVDVDDDDDKSKTGRYFYIHPEIDDLDPDMIKVMDIVKSRASNHSNSNSNNIDHANKWNELIQKQRANLQDKKH